MSTYALPSIPLILYYTYTVLRFALDSDALFILSSAQTGMMPGNIAIRTIRVQQVFSTDRDIKLNRAKDKVFSNFTENKKKQATEQRKSLALAPLFPKPRPMWASTTFVGVFGDAFIENTTLEGNSNLAWTYSLFEFVMNRVAKESFIFADEVGLPSAARTGFSDTLLVVKQSSPVFKSMLRMLKTPNASQLLSFLKKLKKIIQGLNEGESILLPARVENTELLLLLERTADRFFRMVIVQTDPYLGLKYHAVSPTAAMPEIYYRTCMVLDNIPKKNVYDDVFWLTLYNMSITMRTGDMDRFYSILLPFLTGKPLEMSLVEAEQTAAAGNSSEEESDAGPASVIGAFRPPQRSETAYVRCIFEALHFILIQRGLSDLQAKQVLNSL